MLKKIFLVTFILLLRDSPAVTKKKSRRKAIPKKGVAPATKDTNGEKHFEDGGGGMITPRKGLDEYVTKIIDALCPTS
jgi:hypothetical protein